MRLQYNQVSDTILDVKADKRTECFNFGKDNAFPSLIEALIEVSVTSKTCVDRVTKAIYGGSFGDKGKAIVNSKGQTLNEVLRVASREYAKHNNVYLQIGYDGNFDYKSIIVIPATEVRIGKADDKGYSGKFIIYDNWDKSKVSKIMSDGFTYINKFSINKEIAEKQVERLGGIEELPNYNGQLIHIQKDTAKVYSLSDLNPVLNEALLEGNSQVFRSRGAQKGFLNTKLLVTQPFASQEAEKQFKDQLNDVRGAENSSEVVLLASAIQSEDLTKQIVLEDLSSQYNDKLFEYSDTQAEKNICKAFTVPLSLVNPSDSTLFGNSGALLKEAKMQLYESREEDRTQLEETFRYIMANFSNPVIDLEIIDPFRDVEEEATEEATDLNAEAQATLRGSVGGVTSLLAIQQSVALGTTTKEAGIAIIVNIYGFTETEAATMLGDPEEKEATVPLEENTDG